MSSAARAGAAAESGPGPGPGPEAGAGAGPGAALAPGAAAVPGPGAGAAAAPQPGTVRVRRARVEDLRAVVAVVGELLIELGSTPPPESEMLAAAEALHEDSSSGALLLAQADGRDVVGVLVASFQIALHVPGRYAVIQDLWVAPAWRSHAIGQELVTSLCELAGELGMSRAEVGLPRKSFQNIKATETFYLRNGFSPLGPRMRRTFS